jgi:hypothetical protein
MPCLIAIAALAFPRLIIILLWLFSTFFNGVYHGVIIPVLGFLLLPLTLLVYTYVIKTYGHVGGTQLIFIVVAVVIDLGLVSTHRMRTSTR